MGGLVKAILEGLDETGGNVGAVARRLGVSNEYVRRIAKGEVLGGEVERLRDDVVGYLAEQLEAKKVPVQAAIKLLQVLLEHQDRVVRPMSVSVQNQDIRVLVETMERLDVSDLKELVSDDRVV